MVDVSKYAPHIQEGITQLDLASDALARAKEGAKWLDRSPHDLGGSWRLNMISIHNGIVSSHVRMCRNDENPLALAFRHSGWTAPDGRATWASVADKIGWTLGNQHEPKQLGFLEKTHIAPNSVFISGDIDCEFLDEAWATILQNWEWWPQMTPARRQYA